MDDIIRANRAAVSSIPPVNLKTTNSTRKLTRANEVTSRNPVLMACEVYNTREYKAVSMDHEVALMTQVRSSRDVFTTSTRKGDAFGQEVNAHGLWGSQCLESRTCFLAQAVSKLKLQVEQW
ncbi:hypothetical protein Bca101_035940 [Brassica carinata]